MGDSVVAGLCSRLPERRLGGQQRLGLRLIVDHLHSYWINEAAEAGLMRQELCDGDAGLAVGGELRPVAGDGVFVEKLAAICEHGEADRGNALGR